MKRFLCILFLSASVACGQTYNVKVDANGNVLHSQLQSTTTNPAGAVNYATGKLKVNGVAVTTGGGGGGAPVDATYITSTANGTLTNEFSLGSLVTGILKNTTTTGIPTIAVAGTDYASPATTIGGYGITDYNSLGDARWQAKDDDLTSLATATGTHDIYYRSAVNTWSPVVIGKGLRFGGNTLTNLTFGPGEVEDESMPSAATLDVTGLANLRVTVTGGTTISAITGLPDGEEILLKFPDGLTLTHGASLQLLGGVTTIAPANSWGRFRRDGAVVTMLDFQTEGGYLTETFANIFMKVGANIGYDPAGGAYFDVGFNPGGSANDGFIRFTRADWPQITSNDLTKATTIRATATITSYFDLPPYDGMAATVAGIESLTNKKLGDLTTNGFVKVIGGDGTLGSAASIVFGDLATALWTDNPDLTGYRSDVFPTEGAVAGYVDSFSGSLITYILGEVAAAYLALAGGTLSGQLIASPGSTASNSAGVKLQSGALQTTAQAGAMEFLTDAFYLTKTTGATRTSIVLGPSAGPVTIAGPTAARTMTVPNANFTAARTDAANTFTGVQTMTSPALTTPAITGLATGSGVSASATASTLVARDSNGDETSGNFISSVAGKGLQLQSGTGARAGNATLVGGTVTVTNATVNSTNDILLMTRKTSGGTIGMALTYTLSNGASFTMNSDNILDTSTISYMLVKVN